MTTAGEKEVRALHRDLLDAWNRKDAASFAGCFTSGGECIGFDGTQMEGAEQIRTALASIFADHPTARYVSKVRSVHAIASDVVVLRAVAGMVPPGKSELNSATNAVQVLVAVNEGGWHIASFQNTPAAYHGRPEAVAELTEELQALATSL